MNAKRVAEGRWRCLLLCLLTVGCHSSEALVSVRVARTPAGHHLTLVPAGGARINARVKPALERPDGGVSYFDAPEVTADSSYYTGEPFLDLPDPEQPRGLVRVGVCPAGERVCRVIALTL
jgi:hypothetical protein